MTLPMTPEEEQVYAALATGGLKMEAPTQAAKSTRPSTMAELLKLPTFKKAGSVRISWGSSKSPAPKGEVPAIKVHFVDVKTEADMSPNLILKGPVERGEFHAYICVDGHRAYFDLTGKLLGYR
jgi:hypothetical protein